MIKNMKLKFFILAAIIFSLGGITGAALYALYQVRMESKRESAVASQPDADKNKRHSGKDPAKMTEKMKQELNLNDEQAQQVHTILDDSRKEFRKLMKEACPGLTKLRKQTDERIRKILTPEQQQHFDKQLAEREAISKSKDAEEK